MSKIVCIPKTLTPEQAAVALRRSVEINPSNVEESRVVRRTPIGRIGGPKRLTLSVAHRWPKSGILLSVQFMDNPAKALRKRILEHMNAWSTAANVRFDETTEVGEVRIARLDDPENSGYWSYVGTQILGIDDDEPTLNLDSFTMKTPESEFIRVVRHEAGHTLGFEHEHMRRELVQKIDRNKAFAFFDRTQGWDKQETREQVLTPLSKKSVIGTTEADPQSIMCYEIPGSITKDGKAITGGKDITEKDYAFAARMYPLPHAADAKNTPSRPAEVPAPSAPAETQLARAAQIDSDTFHLMILDRFQSSDVDSGKPPARQSYVRVLASYGGARVTVPMRVHAEKGEPPTRFGTIIGTHERIKKYTNHESGSLPDDVRMMAFGSALFETLFQGPVRRLYDEARARQQGRKLDLVFTSMVPWIAEKPWEFAYDESRRSFLATEDVHFIRNVLTGIPADVIPPTHGPLRILVASAQPAGFGRLSIDQETEVIRRGFEPLIAAGLAVVQILPRATPSKIHEALSQSAFSVVHFIGHGVFNEKTQEGALVFEDEHGNELQLGERSAREIFCQRGIKLVFLNSCQSGSGGRTDFNKGVAQSLVAHGLPALVANQYSVLDSSATQFAQHFYWSLAQGMSIGQAAREARIAVNYSLEGESIDWAVPVVYARDPAMVINQVAPAVAAKASRSTKARAMAADETRAYRVAVWDVDNVFPSLDQTLNRLNSAQGHFGFTLAHLSAPVDAWDLENRADDGTPYLWADRLAERLGRVPMSLQVNALACITRHWMRDNDWLNIYGWWPDRDGPPVLIFSCAGLDELQAEGSDTDRALTNLLVSALSGFLSGLDAHDQGAKSCPLWRNPERDQKFLINRQHFDSGCRAKLLACVPKALPALEALLKTFG